jgi:hypothetical protein
MRALVVTQWETGIGIACGLTGLALAISKPAFEGWLTVIFLTWQMCLYLAAPAYSLLSERGIKPIQVTSAGDIDGKVIPETQAARWSVALIALLLLGFLLFSLLPPPTETPIYAKLAPVALDSQKIFKVHPVTNDNNGNKDKKDNKDNKDKKDKNDNKDKKDKNDNKDKKDKNDNKNNNTKGNSKPSKPGKPSK